MKKNFASLLFFIFFSVQAQEICEKHVVVLVTNYNSMPWVEKNLDSIFSQKYENFEVIYVDDTSNDDTADVAEQYINEQGFQDKFTLIRNTKRIGAHENQYNVIHTCKDDDIIVVLDGDDWFSYDGVLSLLNKVYSDPNIWITYGQYQHYPSGQRGACRDLSQREIKLLGSRQFRKNYNRHVFSAPRTFYAGLYKKIKKEDIMYKGKFLFVAGDVAIMLPMIEMAKNGHFKFISNVLYIYNRERITRPEFNQPKRAKDAGMMFAEIKRKAPYKALNSLF